MGEIQGGGQAHLGRECGRWRRWGRWGRWGEEGRLHGTSSGKKKGMREILLWPGGTEGPPTRTQGGALRQRCQGCPWSEGSWMHRVDTGSVFWGPERSACAGGWEGRRKEWGRGLEVGRREGQNRGTARNRGEAEKREEGRGLPAPREGRGPPFWVVPSRPLACGLACRLSLGGAVGPSPHNIPFCYVFCPHGVGHPPSQTTSPPGPEGRPRGQVSSGWGGEV